ncbi:hypothetical protein Hanom_Chr17g01559431 [Helianthus anomalus]
MCFLDRNLVKGPESPSGPCHDVLLVSSFDLTGQTPKTKTCNQSYARFRKSLGSSIMGLQK